MLEILNIKICFNSTIDLLFDLIKKSSLCIFTQIVLSSEFIHNVLRILSFVDFNVLNIRTIVKLNLENILGFGFPFVHVSSQVLLVELGFWVKKSFVLWFSWIYSFCGVWILSICICELSWGLFQVLFTLRNLIFSWNFWAKWFLETVVSSKSLIDIICILSNTNWRDWLSLSIQKRRNYLCLLRLLVGWWKNSLLDWNLFDKLSRLLCVNSWCLILRFCLILDRSLICNFLSNRCIWNNWSLDCLILRSLYCVWWGYNSLSLRNICISSGRGYIFSCVVLLLGYWHFNVLNWCIFNQIISFFKKILMFKLKMLDLINSFIADLLDFSLILKITLRLDILILRLVVNLLDWLCWDVFLIYSHSWAHCSLNFFLVIDFLELVLILVFIFVDWLRQVFFWLVMILW